MPTAQAAPLGGADASSPRASRESMGRSRHDLPPAYSALPGEHGGLASTQQPAGQPARACDTTTTDDQYAFLRSFDTVFLVDDSSSMAGPRWAEASAALASVAPICTQHDADGIDIFFLNAPPQAGHRHVRSAAAVAAIFAGVRPAGPTYTGARLDGLLRPYLARLAARPRATTPLNVIVLTDGEPSDDVESVLIHAARRLDRLDAPPWQVGVQFFQVGNDEAARLHLRQLDDGLAALAGDAHLRDIVDTVPFTCAATGRSLSADGILKVVLGAVNRRLDRRRSQDLHA